MEQGPQTDDHGRTATLERTEAQRSEPAAAPAGLPDLDLATCTAISPGFRVRGLLWRALDLDRRRQTAAQGELHYFRCPRCGSRVAREMLERHWNEWGRICYRPDLGTFDPGCHVFDHRPPGRSAAADPAGEQEA